MAQSSEVFVRIVPFTIEDVRAEEAHLIESLVVSYISDMEGFVVYMDKTQSSAGGAITFASTEAVDIEEDGEALLKSTDDDFLLSARIFIEDDEHVLSLNLKKGQNGEAKSGFHKYKNLGDMALKIRSIVEDYFPSQKQIREESVNSRRITRPDIAGTWRGDNGVEILRFSVEGRGLALFSSGASMELSWHIDGNALIATQVSPNNLRYYRPLPLNVAEKIADEAEPMVWKMFLFESGELRGACALTGAEYDTSGNIKRIIAGKVQKTRWRKLSP